jgi:hypothetical protein
MHAFSTPGATTTSTQHPRRRGRIAHGVRRVAIAAAVTAAISLTGTISQPMVTRAAADGIEIAPGISVTPAPGWAVGNQGPGWVLLHNFFSSAEMEVRVKPAKGTNPVATLQADINNLGVSVTGLTNVKNLGAPTTKPLGSGNFQQEASIDYSADGSSQMGAIPVIGSFIELLNTSNHQSAFIIFAQNGDATTRADNEGQMMIDSLQ